VTVVRDDLLPPFMIATNNNITMAPPTTQTHGIVYHSLCSVVVVLTVLLVELSWPKQIMMKQFSNRVAIKYLKKLIADKFFILIFLVKKTLLKRFIQQLRQMKPGTTGWIGFRSGRGHLRR
jgi:hypothetical protein